MPLSEAVFAQLSKIARYWRNIGKASQSQADWLMPGLSTFRTEASGALAAWARMAFRKVRRNAPAAE